MWGMLAAAGLNILQNEMANENAEDRQHMSQQFSAEEAIKQREFNSAQALAQRDWQERMSNTAVRRNKADLIAAGFNPLLAVHPGGGASTPSGGQATSGLPSAGIASPSSPHNAVAGMATASQISVNEAAADKLKAEADEVRARTPRHEWDIEEVKARIPVHREQVALMKQQIGESAVRIEKIWEEVSQVQATAANVRQQTDNLIATLPLIKAQVRNLTALTAKNSAETDEIKQRVKENLPQIQRILSNLEKLKMEMAQPGQRNQEQAADSYVGQLGAYLREINPLKGYFK